MKAIILAAGSSRRFGDYLGGNPKCLLELGGRSLLEHQLAVLRDSGVTDISIVRGYAADRLAPAGVRFHHNPDYATTNMVHSLFMARQDIEGDVLIAYADILYQRSIIRSLVASAHPVSIAVDVDWQSYYEARFPDPWAEAESLVLDNECIREIGASRPPRDSIQGQYLGLIRLNGEGARAFTRHYDLWHRQHAGKEWVRGRRFESAFMTDFLQALVDTGVPMHGIPVHSGWLEFDTPSDFELALRWQADGSLGRFFRFDL